MQFITYSPGLLSRRPGTNSWKARVILGSRVCHIQLHAAVRAPRTSSLGPPSDLVPRMVAIWASQCMCRPLRCLPHAAASQLGEEAPWLTLSRLTVRVQIAYHRAYAEHRARLGFGDELAGLRSPEQFPARLCNLLLQVYKRWSSCAYLLLARLRRLCSTGVQLCCS